MDCECCYWATTAPAVNLLSGHNPACPKCTPEAVAAGALELIKGLTRIIESCYVGENDKLNNWSAYRKAKILVGE